MKRLLAGWFVVFAAGLGVSPATALAQQALVIKSLAERKVSALPAGPLYWRLENFATLAEAQAAAGPLGLVAQSGGRVWLFTLGAASGATPGATKVAEVGPIPGVNATQYLLRINEASGPPGSTTPVHTHPGSEAFYVLAGESSSLTPGGLMRVGPGRAATGHSADTPMQVTSSGSTDLHSLVMFVIDASRPFSSPAVLP